MATVKELQAELEQVRKDLATFATQVNTEDLERRLHGVEQYLDDLQDQGVGIVTTPDDPQAQLRRRVQATVERWAQPPADSLAKLPKPTRKDNEKGRCDVCGGYHGLPAVHLDYMGHADVTLALLEADPAWTLEPVLDERGLPRIDQHGRRFTMWAYLTLNGVRRMCVGTCDADKGDPEKELIGDALRNGAMRFGIGTRLWSKADGADPFSSAEDVAGRGTPTQREPEPEQPPAPPDPDAVAAVELYERLVGLRGTPAADHMKQWAAKRERPLTEPELRDAEWRELVQAEVARATQAQEAQVPEEPVPPSDGPVPVVVPEGEGPVEKARRQLAEQQAAIAARQAEHVPPEDTHVVDDGTTMEPDVEPPAEKLELCLAQPPAELEHYMACTLPAGHAGEHRWEEPF